MKYLKSFKESSQHPNFITDPDTILEILESLFRGFLGTTVGIDRELIEIDESGYVKYPAGITFCTENGRRSLINGHLPFRFKMVSGFFDLRSIHITTLEGSPEYVGQNFILGNNDLLTSLKGGPREIGGILHLTSLSFTDLEGSPDSALSVQCSKMPQLTSLKGLPKIINRSVTLSDCVSIYDPTALKGVTIGPNMPPNFPRFGADSKTPLFDLLEIFGENFLDSLDYNYFRGLDQGAEIRKGRINLFRFKEAMNEFDIRWEIVEKEEGDMVVIRSEKDTNIIISKFPSQTKLNPVSTKSPVQEGMTRYQFVDDDMRRVDFEGRPIDPMGNLI